MIIVKNIEQYNDDSIFFGEPIKNNIMNDGNFIRIIYSTNSIVFNGIYLLLTFTDIECEKYYNKFKCSFDTSRHKDIIENIKNIEDKILKIYENEIKNRNKNKTIQYKIYEQLKNGNIKIFNEIENKSISNFVLKIAGIWETEKHFGLTYKFIKVTDN